ncbi:MAG: M14 metallopeptidase family protein [Flavobacteriaceae bacterium]
MKNLVLLSVFFFGISMGLAQVSLSYYLPENQNYNPAIPTPESVLGHPVGKWHVSHDKLSEYMRTLAASSDRISIKNRGVTYEDRPLLLLTITSPENHSNIEAIKNEHLSLSEPRGEKLDTSKMPVVVYQGFSIHGNEPSGSNAGLLVAYHLAASQSPEVLELLENTVILFDPSFNPDGLQRFSQWVNTHKAQNITPDSNDREYNEAWPRGRTNHYWFDMNRDWLPVQLNESKARIASFTEWLPNVLTDHHEMGTNETFFFQPGIPTRVNPLTPKKNQELTAAIGKYHEEALNALGSLYYSEEDYDDFYYGKGSTYPDVNGGIGILFEQGSSRGHAQETVNGLLTFPFTIRNQFTVALSTLKAAHALRTNLLDYQREFYSSARVLGEKMRDKAIVFGNEKDIATTYRLAEVLHRHKIKFHRLNKTLKKGGKTYPEEHSFIVPMTQKKQRLVQAIFNEQTRFNDSLFYDVSAWTLSHAFDVNTTKVRSLDLAGPLVSTLEQPKTKTVEKASYAYLFEGHGYYTPKAIYKLLSEDVRVKVSMQPFSLEGKKYDYGSLMVPVYNQSISKEKLFEIMQEVAKDAQIDIFSVETGLAQGIDLGSRNFKTITLPKVALLVGDGIRSYDAGEVWHLMDTQYHMPVTKIDVKSLNAINLNKYTHIVMPSYSGSGLNEIKDKIASWVNAGGHLILYREAIAWAKNQDLFTEEFKETELTAKEVAFEDQNKFKGAQTIGGAIFNAKIDRSHPINFGIENVSLALFRNTRLFMSPEKNSYDNPIQYTDKPLLSGYISEEQIENLKGSVPFKVKENGKGSYLLMTDNTNFRAFWLGTQQLYANMLFYADFM